MSAAIARNAPCPCGSGRRYKECHGALAADATDRGREEPPRDEQLPFGQGENHHTEASLRRLLADEPENVAAWNRLGELLMTVDVKAANDAWWRALSLDPENAEASFHLGNRNREHGEHMAALIHYERALRGAPKHPALLNNVGLSHLAIGSMARAEESFRAALAIEPQQTAALTNLAQMLLRLARYDEAVALLARVGPDVPASLVSLRAQAEQRLREVSDAPAGTIEALLREAERSFARGEHAEAKTAWRNALAIDPGHPEALFHLGNRERESGEHVQAIARYEQALARAPGHAGVLNNLGLALEATGETARAEACYREVLATDPQHAHALANLANLLSARDAAGETVAVYDRLFAVRGDLPAAVWIRRAMAQNQAQDIAGAIESYREAARLAPDDMQVQLHLGTLYIQRRDYGNSELALRRALELDPGNRYALSMLAYARQQRCAWDGLAELFDEIRARLEDGADAETDFPVVPFAALAMPLSARAQLNAAQRWARTISRKPPPAPPAVHYAPGERLRVAFATSNLHDHPTMHLSLEFWEKIDRRRLDMYLYSLRRDDDNPFQRRARLAFEHFADVSQDSVAAISQRIREDRIGILIDRNGSTLNAREGIFPLRPAPIQVNCIGFPGTMGAPWYDYIFTDPYTVPEHLQRFYSERPLYMPHMAFPSDTTRLPPGPPPSRVACGLPESGFVFCCFSNPRKILPEIFTIWMRLLAAVRGSVLWLLNVSDDVAANLRREAAQAGVDPTRLVFAPVVPIGEHVARNAAADLFLDSFPYGAHTTANDALLAGLPVLTCAGETMVSRIAGSQLNAIGLPELIATSLADYEALALRLATHPEELAALRHRLAVNRASSPLFDMARYARDFEDAMHRIWAAPAES
ncbi:MAG TPA: tetratricopeptide repeat protein [Casimicrobiaceae bacterium]|nr:tetratricopeptide repeat protein [Casimicrobiaceae bacterium]